MALPSQSLFYQVFIAMYVIWKLRSSFKTLLYTCPVLYRRFRYIKVDAILVHNPSHKLLIVLNDSIAVGYPILRLQIRPYQRFLSP